LRADYTGITVLKGIPGCLEAIARITGTVLLVAVTIDAYSRARREQTGQ
jgi:ABC-type xylose transport system permease subunit